MPERTPGPWTLNWWTVDDSPKEWRVLVEGDEAHAVADYIRSEADARLIASAPALLAALSALLSDAFVRWVREEGREGDVLAVDNALAAIAKATGTETTDE